jgi:hypothetical protein
VRAKVIPSTGLPMGVLSLPELPAVWYAVKLFLRRR